MANIDEQAKIQAKLYDINSTVASLIDEYNNVMQIEGAETYVVSDMIKGKEEVAELEEPATIEANEQTTKKTKIYVNEFGEIVREGAEQEAVVENAQEDIPHFEPPVQEITQENEQIEAQQGGASINEFGEIIRQANPAEQVIENDSIPHFEPPVQEVTQEYLPAVDNTKVAKNEIEYIQEEPKTGVSDAEIREGAVAGSQVVSGASLEDEIAKLKAEMGMVEPDIVIEKISDEEALEGELVQDSAEPQGKTAEEIEQMVDKSSEPDITVGSYVKDVVKDDLENLKENIKSLTK